MVDIAIIGAGITGLSAAWELQQSRPNSSAVLLDAAAHPGGKLRTDRTDGFVIEQGPDSFLSRKPAGIQLCKELGIAEQLIGRIPENRQTYVKFAGRLHNLPEGLTGLVPTNLAALEASTLLPSNAVTRFAQEREIPPLTGVEESIEQFLTRRFGRITYERLIEPLMGGIYGGRADLLSVDAIFPNLRQLEQTYGSVLAGLDARPQPPSSAHPPFVSFPNGIQTLVDTLVEQLNFPIHTNTPVLKIRIENGTYLLDTPTQSVQARQIIVTTPGYVTARLLRPFAPAVATALDAIPYASSALVTLAYDAREREMERPHGYGYVVPRIEGSDILACTYTSNKWVQRVPHDEIMLVRVFVGRYGRDVTAWSDDDLIAAAQSEFGRTAPRFARVHRWKNGMPQYTLGHRQRITQLDTALAHIPGLYMAGALHGGVGIPDCIRSGRQVVRHLG